ncbi:MAG TPA: bifunctional hydroxymethylpyrimidine kinase/phosphomethylpyrimidine kinase [candidate division Zixibacteria bacterium]|nr:bifunctional hydroxymethylpyrimidine kinase/phosphomethylpyrimidine kinase [candidate division Zixibacteria bacterium]
MPKLSPSVPPPVVLTVAGFDPSSGAGITADLKTIAAHSCYGVAVATALTVQNTLGVFGVEPVAPSNIRESIRRLAEDFEIRAVKIGMLDNAKAAEVVAEMLERLALPNIVLDPILRSSSGARLLDDVGLQVLRMRLIPMASVITPNTAEAAALTRTEAAGELEGSDLRIRLLLGMGAKAVVITGGDLERPDDLLITQGPDDEPQVVRVKGERIQSQATHGTGCAFSTSIACGLANGLGLEEAVRQAKHFVRQAIELAPGLGHGKGPLNHLWPLFEQKK